MKLVDAGFKWTEPHSRRIKLQLKVQKEVQTGVIVQQSFVVDFTVANQACDSCTRAVSNQTWRAVVQLRQKVTHKRTIYFIEQIILKHSAHAKSSGVKQQPDGMDFFFPERSHARSFLEFLYSIAPMRCAATPPARRGRSGLTPARSPRQAQVGQEARLPRRAHQGVQLQVQLLRGGGAAVQGRPRLPPQARGQQHGCAAALPRLLADAHPLRRCAGSMGRLGLVSRVSNIIQLLDPTTLRCGELGPAKYWKLPFRSIASSSNLVEYIVIDVEVVRGRARRQGVS